MTRNGTTQTRSFNYCGNVLQSETHLETGTTTYQYRNDGLLIQKTDAKGQVTWYDYDDYGRVIAIRSGGGNGPVQRSFTYDTCPQGGPPCDRPLGRLTMVDHVLGQGPVRFQEYFGYFTSGAVRWKTLRYLRSDTGLSGDLVATFDFNNEGRMSSIQYPSIWNGSQVVADVGYSYVFDNMGRPQRMNSYGTYVVDNVQYGPANELLQMDWLGHTETRTYNNRLQLTRLRVTGAGGDLGMDNLYTFPAAPNNNGRIQSLQSGTYATFPMETISYQYDALNRLTSAVGPDFTQSISFDGFGNLIARVGKGPHSFYQHKRVEFCWPSWQRWRVGRNTTS